jgi:SOS-response transcriptional repressor LexA
MWYFRKVVGKSMEPAYRNGQVVLVQNQHRFKVGDVVVAFVNKREVVKRITAIEKDRFYLEGDNQVQSTDSRDFGWVLDVYVDGKVIWPKKRKKQIKRKIEDKPKNKKR